MPDPRGALAGARLLLVFTPTACGDNDPFEALEAALPSVDLLQVRPKAPESGAALDPGEAHRAPVTASLRRTVAREAFEVCLGALDCMGPSHRARIPVMVNDRVDVAAALRDRGIVGVHLGQDDCEPAVARDLLGPEALIGLSTHGPGQVARALDEPIDCLGYGPIHPTSTKGYTEGLGAEGAWVAGQVVQKPLFAIGGIHLGNVDELRELGRIAVGSAILASDDPGRAAKDLRDSLLSMESEGSRTP